MFTFGSFSAAELPHPQPLPLSEEEEQNGGALELPLLPRASASHQQPQTATNGASTQPHTTQNCWQSNRSAASLFASANHSSGHPHAQKGRHGAAAGSPSTATAAARSYESEEDFLCRALRNFSLQESAGTSPSSASSSSSSASLSSSQHSDHSIFLPRGLTNDGNTCFMNSILQVLIATTPFRRLLSLLPHKADYGTPATILHSCGAFFKEYYSLNDSSSAMTTTSTPARSGESNALRKSSFSPLIHFKEALDRFDKNRLIAGAPKQEDAQEFLCFLLEELHEQLIKITRQQEAQDGGTYDTEVADEWEEVGKKNKTSKIRPMKIEESLINRIFTSKLRSSLRTQGAKPSITFELFHCIPLDIRFSTVQSLERALTLFMQPEHLDWEVRTLKEYKFEQLPLTLVFQLKRFTFDNYGAVKISKHISFPERLVLPISFFSTNPDAPQRTYTLSAVISHYGDSIDRGHYKCDVKQQHTGTWFEFDDHMFRRVALSQVLDRSAAYLLFYSRIA
ncbi:USP domain-containing protein [Balamuthia mandrillaris]